MNHYEDSNKTIKKIIYLLTQRYNPYPLYWFDLLTESNCYCKYVDLETYRCTIYYKRTCNIWFPISQKEIDYRKEIQPNFNCKFSFKKY